MIERRAWLKRKTSHGIHARGLAGSPLPSVSVDEFRTAAGTLVAGVAVVTTTSKEGRPYGCTVSAVASLSLNPPMMLVCLDAHSRTRAEIAHTTSFAINILADDEEGRRCALLFATKAPDKFSQVGFRLGVTGAPVLGCAQSKVECIRSASFRAGDHVIFAGRVVIACVDLKEPLAYHRGRFRRLARE